VVSTNLKNISQIGSFPQVGVNIKEIETANQLWVNDTQKTEGKGWF